MARDEPAPGTSPASDSLTLVIKNEDYTLGNVLRFFLNLQPQLELTGCTIPHPSVSELNLRVQVAPRSDVRCVLHAALSDATRYVQHVADKFADALERFAH